MIDKSYNLLAGNEERALCLSHNRVARERERKLMGNWYYPLIQIFISFLLRILIAYNSTLKLYYTANVVERQREREKFFGTAQAKSSESRVVSQWLRRG